MPVNDPRLVGMRVPAVGTVRDLQRPDQPHITRWQDALPRGTGAQPPKRVGLLR